MADIFAINIAGRRRYCGGCGIPLTVRGKVLAIVVLRDKSGCRSGGQTCGSIHTITVCSYVWTGARRLRVQGVASITAPRTSSIASSGRLMRSLIDIEHKHEQTANCSINTNKQKQYTKHTHTPTHLHTLTQKDTANLILFLNGNNGSRAKALSYSETESRFKLGESSGGRDFKGGGWRRTIRKKRRRWR